MGIFQCPHAFNWSLVNRKNIDPLLLFPPHIQKDFRVGAMRDDLKTQGWRASGNYVPHTDDRQDPQMLPVCCILLRALSKESHKYSVTAVLMHLNKDWDTQHWNKTVKLSTSKWFKRLHRKMSPLRQQKWEFNTEIKDVITLAILALISAFLVLYEHQAAICRFDARSNRIQ